MTEQVPIKGFERYLIGRDGRIFDTSRNTFLSPGPDISGYIQVSLRPQVGKRITIRAHQLVANHFIPKPEGGDKFVIDHIDNDRKNNHVSNLRWVTSAENAQNSSAKKRATYLIHWNEPRKVYEVEIPQSNGQNKYVGRAETLEEAQLMRDNALKGVFPTLKRLPTYCITHRPERGRFEVSIPIGPGSPKYIGHGKTLEEAQQMRDKALDERDADPNAWKPMNRGKGFYDRQQEGTVPTLELSDNPPE